MIVRKDMFVFVRLVNTNSTINNNTELATVIKIHTSSKGQEFDPPQAVHFKKRF